MPKVVSAKEHLQRRVELARQKVRRLRAECRQMEGHALANTPQGMARLIGVRDAIKRAEIDAGLAQGRLLEQ